MSGKIHQRGITFGRPNPSKRQKAVSGGVHDGHRHGDGQHPIVETIAVVIGKCRQTAETDDLHRERTTIRAHLRAGVPPPGVDHPGRAQRMELAASTQITVRRRFNR